MSIQQSTTAQKGIVKSLVLASRTVKNNVSGIITSSSLSDTSGNPITEANQWTDIQMNFNFTLPNNTTHVGDMTTFTLPGELLFSKAETFEVKNANGDVIANAVIDPATKTMTMTYTDFPETHADVSGSLHFAVRIDTSVVTDSRDVPVSVDVNGQPQNMGTIKYNKVGDSPDEKFMKYDSFANNSGTQMDYVMRVNASGKNYTDASVSDNLPTPGTTYVQSSFRILKGVWKMTSSGFFGLQNEQDVTSQVSIQFASDNRSFTINLGDLQGDGYRIDYKVDSNHAPVNGEMFTNNAQMTGNNIVIVTRRVDLVYQSAGGGADGYNYSIGIHKTGEQGNALACASFDIIRDATNTSVGTFTTDNSGNGTGQGLLRDNYTIKETQAPTGYELSSSDIKATSADKAFPIQSKKLIQ